MVWALYAGFAAAVVWALVKLVREREMLPVVLIVAGLIACNAEPVGDHVGSIVYAAYALASICDWNEPAPNAAFKGGRDRS